MVLEENLNHLNEPNEAIPEVNSVVPEPNQVVDIHDPNEMIDIPVDLVDYDNEDPEEDPKEDPEEDPEEELEEEPKEDVEIELDNDAELYFLMMWRLTKPPPPESGHLIPGPIPKIALLKSKDTIREEERELLNHDLENVERALGNVLDRISVLESGENATLKKRLAETETKLAWARMEHDTAERKLHESRVWNKMFYLDMVRIRAVPKPPSDDEDTERPRKKSKNSPPSGTESLLSHMDHLVTLSCELFLAQVNQKELKEKLLGDVPVIRDSPEVFPEELPGLPPPRQVEFRIDLILGVAPVARTPYHLAPSKMKELSKQLTEQDDDQESISIIED
ncbi:hypothetical protein Tco_1048741 [Tanacetum coccineum]